MPNKSKRKFARKPDAQGFDEVRITTVPIFKTSGLSGDEWRISGKCQLLRKGKVVHEFSMANVENCCNALGFHVMRAGDDGKFFYGGGEDGKCDQEGCSEDATTLYRVKNKYCNKPYEHEPTSANGLHRGFCPRHAKRGDSSYDDSDSNYELITGSIDPNPDDDSPSILGGVVNLGS